MQNENLDVPQADSDDYSYAAVKTFLNTCIPYGSIVSDILSVYIPSSLETRREKWMEEVANVLKELIDKERSLIERLKNDEEFISILLDTTQLALRTHRVEKLKLYKAVLRSSILDTECEFFLKETYLNCIEELVPEQLLMLDFINTNKLAKFKSYDEYYGIFVTGTQNSKPIIASSVNLSTVVYLLNGLNANGMIRISDFIEYSDDIVTGATLISCEDEDDGLPYIAVTEFGVSFLKFIKE